MSMSQMKYFQACCGGNRDKGVDCTFSNSKSEADTACSSILGTWSDSDGDASASSSEFEPEEDDYLPAGPGSTFQNLTTAAEWKAGGGGFPGSAMYERIAITALLILRIQSKQA